MAASGVHQSPEDNRHNKYGSFSASASAKQQYMFRPAFQEGQGFALYPGRFEHYRSSHNSRL
jgi:hypothetical protein